MRSKYLATLIALTICIVPNAAYANNLANRLENALVSWSECAKSVVRRFASRRPYYNDHDFIELTVDSECMVSEIAVRTLIMEVTFEYPEQAAGIERAFAEMKGELRSDIERNF